MPGPVPYSDIGGGGKLPPHGEDYFNRIVNVHWPKRGVGVAEQGLLVVYKGGGSSGVDHAVALDTGDEFPGISTGATGILKSTTPFTVLTGGVVVYGKPRDGDPCFMACNDGTTILRGHQDVGGDMKGIVWDAVYSSPGLCALSFAGDAFFVMSQDASSESLNPPISCAVSFNGKDFQDTGDPYAGVPPRTGDNHHNLTPGAVASNGKGVYTTVGIFDHNDSYGQNPGAVSATNNMMWASSGDGTSWNSGYSYPEAADPGIRPDSIIFGYGSDRRGNAYTTVAGGAGIFVAAATKASVFRFFPVEFKESNLQMIRPTAAAAVSSNGSSWGTVPLPGATQALSISTGGPGTVNKESVSLSVAFVRTSGSAGYFIITANGFEQTTPAPATSKSWCWKGDGTSWDIVKESGAADFGTVSAIARDLSATTIVYI